MKTEILGILLAASLFMSVLSMISSGNRESSPSSFFIQEVDAQVQEPQLLERGRDFARYHLGGSTYKYEAGLPPWAFDSATGEWVPHVVRDLGNDTVEVQSGMISWRIRAYDADIYDANFTSYRATERWMPEISGTIIEKFFDGQTVTQNNTGVFVTNSYSGSFSGNTVTAQVIYAIYDGRPTERIVLVDGVPANLSDRIKISREWVAVDSDEVVFDSSASATIESTTTIINTLTVKEQIRFMKNGALVVHENLGTAGENYKETHYREGYIKFVYTGWEAGLTSIKLVDDTYSSASPTAAGRISTASGTGTSCGAVDSINTATRVTAAANDADLSVAGCVRGIIEWDVSSIADGSDVINVVFKFDVITVSGLDDRDVQVRAITAARPSVDTASNVWNAIGSGTTYVTSLVETTGDNKEQDLGISADSDLESQLASDWFAIGTMLSDETRESTGDHGHSLATSAFDTPVPNPTLEVTYTLPTVTVPIAINMRTGSDTPETAGVSFTVTCTGGGGTHDGNTASQNFTCNPSVTVTVDVSADTGTSRFRFSDGTTQKSFTSCASGTCSTTTYSDVTRQFKQIVDLTGSPADMPASVTVTRTIIGSQSTQEVDETSTDVWPDQGSTISIEDPVSISATERWDTSGTVSWTVDQGRTISNTYYQQFGPTVTGTGISASVTSVTVTRTQQGSQSTEDIAGSTATTIWADYNTLISVEDPVSISATERWDTSGTVSWTQTDATNRATGEYFRQWKQDVDLAGLTGVNTITVTRTILGSGGTQEVDNTLTTIWADHGSTISLEDPLVVTANEERFDTGDTISYTVDQGRTIAATYYRQWNPDVTATGVSAAVQMAVTRTQLGSPSTEDIDGGTSTGIWADDSTTLSIENPKAISATEQWITPGTRSWTITDATARASSTYYHQYKPTLTLSGLGSESITVTRVVNGSSNTPTQGNGAVAYWVDAGETFSAENPHAVSATERYKSTDTASWTQNDATARSVSYRHQWQPTVTLAGLDAQSVTVSYTVDGAGQTPSQSTGSTAYWIDDGTAVSFTNPLSLSATEQYIHTGAASTTVSSASAISRTYYHQWKPTVTFAGLDSQEVVVTRTVNGTSGTTANQGTGGVAYWTDHGTVLMFTDPLTISATERYDTGDTSSHTISNADAISATYYRQFEQTITLSGVDSVRSLSVTRTQLGSQGSSTVSGSTATEIWADSGTTVSVPGELVIVASEDRFKSYNSTAQREYAASSGGSKTFVFQHEYNMLFRVYEEHLGFLFIPMPDATYTGTITTANGTLISGTFDEQVTDDYLQLDTRYWVKNGTTSWQDVKWRGLVANATGSQSITEYGNFDIESATKHYGYTGNRHFRLLADGGTIDEDTVVYDSNAGSFTFNATATGTKSVKVEYLRSIYSGVSSITVDGVALIGSEFVDEAIDSSTGVVTLSDVAFSERTIAMVFQASAGGSPSSGGSSGGGGPSSPFVSIPTIPSPFGGGTTGSSAGLTVTVPIFRMSPGGAQTQDITFKWQGDTVVVIDRITFTQNPQWFVIGKSLPHTFALAVGETTPEGELPMTVMLPDAVTGSEFITEMSIGAHTGNGAEISVTLPVKIQISSASNSLGFYFTVAAFAAFLGGVGYKAVKSRHPK